MKAWIMLLFLFIKKLRSLKPSIEYKSVPINHRLGTTVPIRPIITILTVCIFANFA